MGTSNVEKSDASVEQRLEAMTALIARQQHEMQALRSELNSMREPTAKADEPAAESTPAGDIQGSQSRRTLLRGGAAAIGASVAALAITTTPAAAADNDNLVLGQSNQASSETLVENTANNTALRGTSGVSNAGAVVGENSNSAGFGVRGLNTASTGTAPGVFGETGSTAGIAVYGQTTATTGTPRGLFGITAAPDGLGAYGQSIATTGAGVGVYGQSASPDATAVYGVSTATSGSTGGVRGDTGAPTASGVRGTNSALTDEAKGVYGTSSSVSGRGVQGDNIAVTGTTTGVAGFSNSPDGRGVYGQNNATSGVAVGVWGRSSSDNGRGVYGRSSSSNASGAGVFGSSNASNGRGVYGEISNGTSGGSGVHGQTGSPSGNGVYGNNTGGGHGGQFRSDNAAVAARGAITVVPTGTTANGAPAAPVHVKQNGAGTPVELLLQLESDTAPQQVFLNNNTGAKWFFAMTSDDEFKISRAGSGSVEAKFFGNGNLNLAGTLNQASDVNVKHDIEEVDAQSVLDRLAAMPVSTWKYDADPDVTHLGPTAQDFAKAFNLGESDTVISTVDADGVALAAIKALHQQNLSLQSQLNELRTRLDC